MYSGAVHTISIALEIHNIEPAYKSITDKANYEETYALFSSVYWNRAIWYRHFLEMKYIDHIEV
jgi:hypothetical protein